jgi:hypothetical protein
MRRCDGTHKGECDEGNGSVRGEIDVQATQRWGMRVGRGGVVNGRVQACNTAKKVVSEALAANEWLW